MRDNRDKITQLRSHIEFWVDAVIWGQGLTWRTLIYYVFVIVPISCAFLLYDDLTSPRPVTRRHASWLLLSMGSMLLSVLSTLCAWVVHDFTRQLLLLTGSCILLAIGQLVLIAVQPYKREHSL